MKEYFADYLRSCPRILTIFFGAASVSLARIHSIFGAGPDNDPDARILTDFLPLQRSSVNSKNSEVISCLGGVLRSPNNITLLMYSSQ